MKEFIVGTNDAGQRLDRWLAKTLPLLPAPLAQKYIRLKRVKLNGRGAKRDVRLVQGDLLQLYINDEFFQTPTPENAFLSLYQPKLTILYEDEHILLVDKRPGLVVHPDETERVNTLITHIAAKTAEGLRVMNQKIRDRELKKYYLCIVHGTLPRPAGRLEGYILKDEAKKQVTVSSRPRPGAKTAVTLYETLAVRNGLSLVRCQLITGRTHQIRAQFAAAGHPLLGDGKYGSERQNKRYGRSYQALYSYRLEFCFTTDAGALAPLDGQQFQVEQVDFVTEYFPGFSL